MRILLDIAGLSVAYGHVTALQDLSLAVPEGGIVALLGANGAGKTSLLKAVAGVVRPRSGRVVFDGRDITAAGVPARLADGLVLVPEGRRILVSLTIEENLLVGAHLRRDPDGVRRDIAAIYERFPNLGRRRHMAASCLSGGEQQMLAVGRAMIARPRLLMLDEPSLGLSPLFIEHLFALIRALNRDGITILLVEQNTAQALAVAHTAAVLELGRIVMAGDPAQLAGDPRLAEAYLGRAAGEPAALH
ncbi:ABC transporter ATP-binding protein [Methylobacterium currus]|uniref:ABC transporter ATP-binding protein n=1 Tax=Methylobacterium currus TaxID=2051553 RepID=A0A2R4WVW9_9HYPH|nr:ABC transporter ATP-binding protein [Methylobacterium currus]AWB25673.1 ABC transporter ATP-binding protein [Methylobacterium currus]UHC19383.1 ABC transporter ATP-binding protein [Methylobacterium currus]